MANKLPIGLSIAIIDRTFRRKMDEKASSMGLTSTQIRVLGEISLLESSGTESINQKMLEELEQVTHPTMTGILKRLEAKGFIKSSPGVEDRRQKRICSTGKSEGIHKLLTAQDEEVLQELCQGMTQGQMEQFLSLSQIMVENASKDYYGK